MALRSWSGRRIATLWILGIALYGGLAIFGRSQRLEPDAQFSERYGLLNGGGQLLGDTLSNAGRDSSLALLFALWRETSRGTPAHRDSIVHRLRALARDTVLPQQRRDSLYRALNVPATLSPSQQDSLRVVGESLVGAVLEPALRAVNTGMRDMAPWLVLMFALLVAPAAALIVTTIAWVFLRRHDVVNSGAPAA